MWQKNLIFLDYQKKNAGLLAAREVLTFTSFLDLASVPALLPPCLLITLL
jgi:hypothetical protein